MQLIKRKEYLKQLINWRDKKVIKVITGVRRCGKSTLMDLYKSCLLEQGVANEQIISINFEDYDYIDLQQFTAFKPLAHRPKPMLAKP